MIRVLLCGEGAHDIGLPDLSSGDDRSILDGWLQALIRRFTAGQLSFHIRRRSQLIILPKVARNFRPLPAGHGRLALLSKLNAVTDRYDAVIFMADADTRDARKWREKYRQISDGFGRINNSTIAIACLPMSASESWLLADVTVWRHLGLADQTVLPSRPETIWGNRHDPDGNHPHQQFARACENAWVADDRPTRVEIAKSSGLSTLTTKCPVSFPPFRDQLANLAAALSGDDA
jgi:hypothetical protein